MFNDTSHVLQAAVEGQGVALTRSSLIGNDLNNGLLVQPFQVSVPSQFKYFLVYPPRLAQSPKLALFRDWLRDEVAADPNVASVNGVRRKSEAASKRTRRAKPVTPSARRRS